MELQPQEKVYPFYVKATVILFGLALFFFTLRMMGAILSPLAFAALIAILLNPLFIRLNRRLPRVVAITFTVLIGLAIVTAVFYFLSTKITAFSKDLPVIKAKFLALFGQVQHWLEAKFGIAAEKQVAAIKQAVSGGNSNMISNTLGTIFGMVSFLVLLPIYVFLILYYKPLILDFMFNVFSEKYSLRVAEVLSEVKSAIQQYMVGLMIETVIVCVLNSIALLIIGVPNAVIIGVIGGILNLLPYIGGLIAYALPILMSLITFQTYTPIIEILAAYTLIQLVDNHFLVPYIVSSKVKINALFSIVIVLLGGLLWGTAGMFLSIPFIAVLKIIFDRVDGLKPWGKLLGDEVPTEHVGVAWQKRWNRIFRTLQKKQQAAIEEDKTN